jgi:hypothetical protein
MATTAATEEASRVADHQRDATSNTHERTTAETARARRSEYGSVIEVGDLRLRLRIFVAVARRLTGSPNGV